ncbi:MAG TPA: MBL fold metallo-hydrolase [Gammaproteobacteria bacterium]|jgi:beta-lactamase superfamily II metal-dependent hydrolase
MRTPFVRLVAPILLATASAALSQSRDTLDIYVFDTEGGEAVLYIAPTGEAMLFDTGREDTFDRIHAVIEQERIPVLDYVIVSHYHGDHVGGAWRLPELPVRNYRQLIDHGPYTTELQPQQRASFERYLALRSISKARRAVPGETLSFGAVDVHVVASSGEQLASPLPGGGEPNPLCRNHVPKTDLRAVENDEVVSIVVRYGDFAFLELGDLIWNDEQRLVCPDNLLGTADVYHTSGHAAEWGSNPVMVHAVRPRVAVMNNAAVKGGHVDTFATLRGSPRLEDVWQIHYSTEFAATLDNSPEDFIANLDGADGHAGHYIKFSARADGSFTVTNGRNGFTMDYPAVSTRAAVR